MAKIPSPDTKFANASPPRAPSPIPPKVAKAATAPDPSIAPPPSTTPPKFAAAAAANARTPLLKNVPIPPPPTSPSSPRFSRGAVVAPTPRGLRPKK